MSNFNDLLQDAERMKAQIDQTMDVGGSDTLPRMQRPISQLLEMGRRKLTASSFVTGTGDMSGEVVNASLLLASKGIDAAKLAQNLERIQMPSPSAPMGSGI